MPVDRATKMAIAVEYLSNDVLYDLIPCLDCFDISYEQSIANVSQQITV